MPVIALKILRHALGNNMSPYDSETIYKPVGQKIKSKHTWYLKKKHFGKE